MKKILFISLLISQIVFFTSAFGQDFGPPPKPVNPNPPADATPPFWSWDRVYYGGGIGGGFYGGSIFINLNPQIGYKITERFSVGVGASYIYLSVPGYSPAWVTSIYGGDVFSRFFLTKSLFLHAEFEELNGQFNPFNPERYFIDNVWVGGGIRQRAGRTSVNIMVLFNLVNNPYTPFPSPEIMGGVGIGF